MSRRWSGREWGLLALGLLALLACLLAGLADPRSAMLCYLAAWLFWLAPVLGSLALLAIHALTGGQWGLALRPALLALSARLPRMALLAIPVLAGMTLLYPWIHPAPHDAELQRQRWYLNAWFFIARTVVAFGLWWWLGSLLRTRLAAGRAAIGLAAGFLIVHLLLVTFTGADWVMSLQPKWHSSAFGLTLAVGQILLAGAMAVPLALAWCAGSDGQAWPAPLRRDLGNVLLAAVMGFGYLLYMGYLTVWIADLPTETVWYLPRLRTGWAWSSGMLAVGQVILPFLLLLWRGVKDHRGALGAVAVLLCLAQLVYAAWLVLPGQVDGVSWLWLLPLAWAGIGGLWWPGLRGAVAREVHA